MDYGGSNVRRARSVIDAELAELKARNNGGNGGRSGIIGRTHPDFLDRFFGIHAGSEMAEEVLAEIDAKKENLTFFSGIAVVEYDARADAQFVSLKQIVKNKVGMKDPRIAAIVLAHGTTLLTRNTRDFGKIPGLLFADWTI
ncbi:MAG: type II toxin-antitoxin system VapC family toxin [Fibrella sp.]|nr:type II toxin-antitoxin system VapC family toxin [Armatimonadota bacterium]